MLNDPTIRRLFAVSLVAAFGLSVVFLFGEVPADQSLTYIALFAMAAGFVDQRPRKVMMRILDVAERALVAAKAGKQIHTPNLLTQLLLVAVIALIIWALAGCGTPACAAFTSQ